MILKESFDTTDTKREIYYFPQQISKLYLLQTIVFGQQTIIVALGFFYFFCV